MQVIITGSLSVGFIVDQNNSKGEVVTFILCKVSLLIKGINKKGHCTITSLASKLKI